MTRQQLVSSSAVMLLLIAVGHGQTPTIDTAHSKATIRVFKSGLFSAFAHDHTIVAPVATGRVDAKARTVELSFRVKDMKVMDPDVSDKDRAQIDADMKGEKVLDGARYPEIKFVSRQIESTDDNHFFVRGDLTLHGVTKAIEVPVVLSERHYAGNIKLKQTDFGITPIKVAGGTVKVKDVVELTFEIFPSE
jgi:polyisoprenoid-binding protein YceI